MVVSGCPEPKEDPEPGYFTAEIAKFSIQLMDKVQYELSKVDCNSGKYSLTLILIDYSNLKTTRYGYQILELVFILVMSLLVSLDRKCQDIASLAIL